MKVIKYIFLLFLITMPASSVFSQHKDMARNRRQNMFGRDLFAFRFYNFADTTNEHLSRMVFHVGVVNDLLTFVKNDSGTYKARYEVAVVIYNKNKEPIVEKSVSHRVTASSFAETNSRRNPRQHSIEIELPPDRYRGELQLLDMESDERLIKDLEFTARDFTRDLVKLSDIMFIDKIDTADSEIAYLPNLTHVFDNVKSAFAARVEIYPPKNSKEVQAHFAILDANGKHIFDKSKTYSPPAGTISAMLPFRKHLTKPGDYIFMVNASSGGHSAKIQRMFSVIWGSVPIARNNLNIAIDQLALIANKSDITAMRNADEEKRKQLFDQFWRQRDPTPLTQKNELEEQFFKRVDFSNRNFSEISSGRLGWQTDRGKIYIVYGPPDQVNHDDSDVHMPSTEIWYYNRISRKYYFTDRSGDGVFRLVKVE